MITQFEFKDICQLKIRFIGIYCIASKYDTKTYVGQTAHQKGFRGRWEDHRELLRKGKHDNIFLQRSYNKHGESQFVFRILEICTEDENLNNREKYWMENLKSMFNQNGWNIDYIDDNDKRRCEYRPRQCKDFEVMTPHGEIIKGNNRKKFVLEHGLDDGCFCRLINGKLRSLLGWKSLHPNAQIEYRTYEVINPEGVVMKIQRPASFAVKNGLSKGNFCAMVNGKLKTAKGWRLNS